MSMQIHFKWPGKVWLYSDMHFNHEGILGFDERKEFKTIKEHNEFIIKKIKSRVKPEDTFLCLGDIGNNFLDLMSEIPGYKVLIRGNHDRLSKKVYREVFDEFYNGPIFLNQFLVCSHEPIPLSKNYYINIHGHLHGSVLNLENYINISCAMVDYNPIDLDSIIKKYEKRLKRIRKEPFLSEWYKDNYIFKKDDQRGKVPCFSDGLVVPNAKGIIDLQEEYFKFRKQTPEKINFKEIDFDEFKKKKWEKKNIFDLFDTYFYKKDIKNQQKIKEETKRILEIFKCKEIEELIKRKIFIVLSDDFREKYLEKSRFYLIEAKIASFEGNEITVKTSKNEITVDLETFLREQGDFWWIERKEALLAFKLLYDPEGKIEK